MTASSPDVHTIGTGTHGRYLVARPATSGPAPLLVGFHGYAQDAESCLDNLRRMPATSRWHLASVQALHRFYRGRGDATVASWMTRQDRTLLIADNVAYAAAVVDAVRRNYPITECLVFAGFSQGVAMAYRAAARSGHACHGLISLAGDIPPDVRDAHDIMLPRVLIGRGTRDEWYSAGAMEADVAHLRNRGVPARTVVFDGGHEWGDAFVDEADRFLAGVERRQA